MTRKDQTTRAWIKRDNPRHPFTSYVSHKGKVNKLSTNTRLRKSAIEFNVLHTVRVLTQKEIPQTNTAQIEINF